MAAAKEANARMLRGKIYYRSNLPRRTGDNVVDSDHSNANSDPTPKSSGRKRKRHVSVNEANDFTPSSLTDLIFVEDTDDDKDKNASNNEKTRKHQCHISSTSTGHKRYLLSVPKSMIELAHSAARNGWCVELVQYTKVEVTLTMPAQLERIFENKKKRRREHHQDHSGGNGDRDHEDSTATAPVVVPFLDGKQRHDMIEIHCDGLRRVWPDIGEERRAENDLVDTVADNKGRDSKDDNLWTLVQFWRKEFVDEKLQHLNDGSEKDMKKKASTMKARFNIIAAVEAVSSTIVWNTTDPNQHFALVELYDPPKLVKGNIVKLNAVLVLKGTHALTWRESLIPSMASRDSSSSSRSRSSFLINGNEKYDLVVIRNVVCTRWRVPEELFRNSTRHSSKSRNESRDFYKHLKGRIPSKVFVATDTFSVERISRSRTTHRVVPLSTNRVVGSQRLAHVRGRLVRDAETVVVSLKTQIASMINYVDIIEEGGIEDEVDVGDDGHRTQPRRILRVFLTHCPLSTAMQWSLREGAVIEVLNLHLMCSKVMSSWYSRNSDDFRNCELLLYGTSLRSSIVVISTAGEQSAKLLDGKKRREQAGRKFKSGELATSSSQVSFEWQMCPQTQRPLDFSMQWSNSCWSSNLGPNLAVVQFCTESWLPYACWRIRETCFHFHIQDKVDKWVKENFSDRPLSSSTKTHLVEYLVDTGQSKQSSRIQASKFKSPSRDPYAEFFNDSCFESPHGECVQDSPAPQHKVNFCNPVSTINRDLNRDDSNHLILASISQLREASQRFVISRLRAMLSIPSSSQYCNEIIPGWIGSVNAPARDILAEEMERGEMASSKPKYLVGGYVGECRSCPSSRVAAIYDSRYQVPVCFAGGDERASIDDFILGFVDRVSVSCFCLGSRRTSIEVGDKNDTNRHSTGHQVNLPSLASTQNGGCSIVEVDSLIFVTAVFVECKTALLLSSSKNHQSCRSKTVSVEEFLQSSPDRFKQEYAQSKICGMLLRNSLQMSSSKNGPANFHLSISSCHIADGRYGIMSNNWIDTSCLQSMNIVMSLEHNTARLIAFTKALDAYWKGTEISEKQRILGSIFWTVGNSGVSCPIILGGYEEDCHCSARRAASFTIIYAPSNALRLRKGGSFHLECGVHQLETTRYTHSQHHETIGEIDEDTDSIPHFDFVGSEKFLTGMLQRRIERRDVFERKNNSRVVGEISALPSPAIPTLTISEMMEALCRELRDSSSSNLRPSLTRRLIHCRFLGVSYCEVRCACMKCFRALTSSSPEIKNSRKGIIRKDYEEFTFWHLPPPLISSLKHLRTAYAPGSDDEKMVPVHIRQSGLSCPNQCPKKFYGVKWECSGILDDGTGQAQLYTERETALALLGIPAKHIEWIEHGIWFTGMGVLKVQKTSTPSKEILDTVRNLRRNPSVIDPIKVLPPRLRAEYLLEHYCRSSMRSRRPLDYYVRCKPLDRKIHVEHGTVESFIGGNAGAGRVTALYRGETLTYKLPRLNLQLIDCGIPSSEYVI